MAPMRHKPPTNRTYRMALAGILLGLATPAFAARDFRIGPERFAEADILDARAVASVEGAPVVMITLTEAAAPRLQKLTEAMLGKALPIQLDGKELMAPVVREAIAQIEQAAQDPALHRGEQGFGQRLPRARAKAIDHLLVVAF